MKLFLALAFCATASALSKRICCRAMTKECLACAQGVTVETYCANNPGKYGCPTGLARTTCEELPTGELLVHYNSKAHPLGSDPSWHCALDTNVPGKCNCKAHPSFAWGACKQVTHKKVTHTVAGTCRPQYECFCHHGKPLTGDKCKAHAVMFGNGQSKVGICGSCDSGYTLHGGGCHKQRTCFCHHGTPLKGDACTKYGIKHNQQNPGICGACNAGYKLQGGGCHKATCSGCKVVSIQHGHTGNGPGNGMYAHFLNSCMQRITGGYRTDRSTYIIQMRNGKVLRKGYAQMWSTPNNGGGGLGSGYGHLRWCADSYRGTSKTFNCQAGDFRVDDIFVATDAQATDCGVAGQSQCQTCPVVSIQHGHTGNGPGNGMYAHFETACMQRITGGFKHDRSTFTVQMRGGKVLRSGYAQMWTSPNNGGGGLGSGFGHLRWCADSYRGTSKTFNCQAGDFRVGDEFTNDPSCEKCYNCPVVSIQHGHTGSGPGNGMYAHFENACMQKATGGFKHDKSTFTIQKRNGKVIRSGYAQMWTSPNNGGGGLGSGFGHLRWCANSYRGTSKTFNCQAGDFRVGDVFTNCAN